MYVIDLIILLILVFVLCCITLFFRNIKTFKYLENVAYRAYIVGVNDDSKTTQAIRIIQKHSYSEILFSLKPIKDEYWFTKEEIEFLNQNKDLIDDINKLNKINK